MPGRANDGKKYDERVLIDGATLPWIRFPHVERYDWITPQVHAMIVGDAACGVGYGASALRREARIVDGFDISADAIKSAKERYRGVDISFIQADVLDLPREANYYDAFVSLETVEHIPDTIAYLKEIRRVLRPGGKFYCSTPNRQVTNPGTAIQDKPYNPWHLFEFSPSEFETQLRQVFEDVQLFGQGFFKTPYISTLESIGMTSPPIAVRIHQLRKVATAPFMRAAHYSPHSLLSTPTKIPECLLAVCS